MTSTFELLKSQFRKEIKKSNDKGLPKLDSCLYPVQLKKPIHKMPERLPGHIHKRCAFCNSHIYVFRTDKFTNCWSCGKKLKITDVGAHSTFHISGIIVQKVLQ